MTKPNWFEREFNFQHFDISLFPLIMERLRGTPARLEQRIAFLPAEVLTKRLNGAWSIQEHAGHLGDLETLWYDRLLDILDGKPMLRLADLSNTKTHLAGHNENHLISILQQFRHLRSATIRKLDTLETKDLLRSAVHPRLNTSMRIADLFLFVSEHDDHHLATITEILKTLYHRNSSNIRMPSRLNSKSCTFN